MKKEADQKKRAEKFFKETPRELISLLFSKELSRQLAEICLKEGTRDEKSVKKVAELVTRTIIGKLPPKEFLNTLKKESKLSPSLAARIFSSIDSLIFSKVRSSLNKLYLKKKNKDKYREPIE